MANHMHDIYVIFKGKAKKRREAGFKILSLDVFLDVL